MNTQRQAIRDRLPQHPQQAIATLVQIARDIPREEQRSLAYLSGWALALAEKWEEARATLKNLVSESLQYFNGEDAWSDKDHAIVTSLRLGYAAIRLEWYDDAEAHLRGCRLSMTSQPKYTFLRYQVWYLLSYVASKKGQDRDALRYTSYAKKAGGKTGLAPNLEANLHACRAFAYWHLQDYTQMRTETCAALALYQQTGKLVEQVQMTLFLAECARQLASPHERLQALEEALRLAALIAAPLRSRFVAEVCLDFSLFYKQQGGENVATATHYDDMAREAARESGDFHLLATTLLESSRTSRRFALRFSPLDGDRISLLLEARSYADQALALPLSDTEKKGALEVLLSVLETLGLDEEVERVRRSS